MPAAPRLLPHRASAPVVAALLALTVLGAGAAKAAAVPVIVVETPTLVATTVHPGDTLTATTHYTNLGTTSGRIVTGVQTVRRPGQPHDHPVAWDGNFTNDLVNEIISPGEHLLQTGTLTLAPTVPTGTWEIYASWQGTSGVWHDSPSGSFTVAPVPTPTPTPLPTPTPAPDPPLPAPPAAPAPVVTPTPDTAAPTVVAAQGPASTPPVAAREFTATQAQREARTALRRIYGTALTRGTRFASRCRRTSATRQVCTVTWRYRGRHYHGRVVVVRNGSAVTTTVYVTRSRA
jgi:hypothetical protein